MMKFSKDSSGFTAVELLVTLFVAAAFLIAGYQLFSVVIRDGGQTRAEANASNVAYDYLRQYSTSATNPCAPLTPLNEEPITIEGLVSVSATVAITCPNSDARGISKVKVTIKYNNPQQTVQYSTFVNGVSEPSAVMNGLIGWWRMNGNPNDSISLQNGVVSGAALTTGQNGRANSAYSFDGVNDYLESPVVLNETDSFTITAWARGLPGPSAANGHGYVFHQSADTSQGNSIFWAAATSGTSTYNGDVNGFDSPTYSFGVATGSSNWRFLALTYDGSTRTLFGDGTGQPGANRGAITNSITSSTRFTIGGTAHDATYRPFQGDIDDVRIYNRALSGAEITTLYNEGAL